MGFIEDMKWWHWIAISVLVGLVLAYTNASNNDLPPVHASMSPVDFERNLIRSPVGENHTPWITDVTVYPPLPVEAGGGRALRQLVVFRCMVVPQDQPQNARLQWFTLMAPVPYEAMPRWPVGYNGDQAYPGVSIYVAKKGDTLASVTADQFGQDSPEGENAIISANELLRTAESRSLVRIRSLIPYYIPWNPASNRTVADLLDDAARLGVPVTYRTAWWEAPRYLYEFWIGGSFLVIGVIWPGLLRMMLQGGLGRSPEAKYDLGRFKSEPEKPAAKPVGITEADLEQVKAMADNLEASLRAGATAAAPGAAPVTTSAAPIKKLSGSAAEPSLPTMTEQGPKEYTGEFYPVELPKAKPEDSPRRRGEEK
jgi:hypothetical protein